MNTWHYELVIRGTITNEHLTTERTMREEIKRMYGPEAAESAVVWRAGEERPDMEIDDKMLMCALKSAYAISGDKKTKE